MSLTVVETLSHWQTWHPSGQ